MNHRDEGNRTERATGIDVPTPPANKYQGSENLNTADFLATLKKYTDEVSQTMKRCFPDPTTGAISSEANFQAFRDATNHLKRLRSLPKHAAVLLVARSNLVGHDDMMAIINKAAEVTALASVPILREEKKRREEKKESREDLARVVLENFGIFEQRIRNSRSPAELQKYRDRFYEYVGMLKQDNPKTLFGSPDQEGMHIDAIGESLNTKIAAVKHTIDATTAIASQAEHARGISVPTPPANRYQDYNNLNSAEFLIALKRRTDEVCQASNKCFVNPGNISQISSQANFQVFLTATKNLQGLRSLPKHAAILGEVQSDILDRDAKMAIINRAAKIDSEASNLLSKIESDRANPSPAAENPGPR